MSVQATNKGRRVHDEEGEVALLLTTKGESLEMEVDGHIWRGAYERSAGLVRVMLGGQVYEIRIAPEIATLGAAKANAGGSGAVLAPMPGVVAEVKVAIGDRVEVGEVVIVLESMKLFTSLTAAIAGTVSDIACRAGETVAAGKRLLLIESVKPS
jgi:3-methylcrotonyl-CoA carboxylase alpha subunit